MPRVKPSQAEALRTYKQCRDAEAGLLNRPAIRKTRVAIGVLLGAVIVTLLGALFRGLGRMFT